MIKDGDLMGFDGSFTIRYFNIAKMAIYSDFSQKKMVIFHSDVGLPEGIDFLLAFLTTQ